MKGIFPVRGHRTNHNIVVCSPGTVVVRSHVVDLVTIRQGGCVVPGGSFLMCGSTNGERVQRGARRMHGLVTQGLRCSPALGRSLPRFHIATKQRCVLPGIIRFPSHKQLSQYRHSTYTNNNKTTTTTHAHHTQPPNHPTITPSTTMSSTNYQTHGFVDPAQAEDHFSQQFDMSNPEHARTSYQR